MQENINENHYEIIETFEKDKWNEIVKSFSEYDVFYLVEYVEALKINEDGEPYLFYYNYGKTRAINVFIKKDIYMHKEFKEKISKNTYFDIFSPYGYGGFLIEGDNYREVNEEYTKYCVKNNIICEFVRFNLFSNFHSKYSGIVEKIKPNIVRKIDMSPNDMLMDFEYKVRKNLKRANENDLQVELDYEGKKLDEFLEIYYSTMERNEAKKEYYFTKEFFEKLNEMNENKVYFNVLYKNKIISTELVIYSNKNCYSYLGGTLSEYFNLRPNDFLKYEIIKWAYNNNLKNYVLGGGYTNDVKDGILKYKKSFAPNNEMVDFYVGKKIFNKSKYNELVNIRKKDKNFDVNSNFFPLYRIN